MHDFTKEELEYIKNYIFNGSASISVESHEILRTKMQDMIDNYCEHESDGQIYCSLPPQNKCKKCGKFYR
jgi:hypothetical protein